MSGTPDSRVADEGRLDVEQISGAAKAEPRRDGAGHEADRGAGLGAPRGPGHTATEPAEGAWRFPVPATGSSVPRTRHAVRDRLLAQGMGAVRYQELVDDLLLIVSELVSNAVTHAAKLSPEVTTELTVRGGWVRVSVEDGDPYRPKALESDTARTGGRGLLLVKSVTLQAGGMCDVERTREGGKVIWASLPIPPRKDD
ncbi:ATP-binding protein [Streptomyces kaniharaensis]|uniref:ATP-binding protein n=1 Tax=Streptomyces kaniharaensis TaxID=212423 RepID=A0A6N7KZ49_9ACTN|nr:ATP-binding protein [Streptomyces kaniharaensis]MQS15244.1 ATP-binding protein [Streptomyces kaniharaensis]